MEIRQMERQVLKACAKHGWEMKPFEDLGLLTEEVGELAREIRRMENGRQRPDEQQPASEETREHIAEELGDILFPLIKIAAYYNIPLEKAFHTHIAKMEDRYKVAPVEANGTLVGHALAPVERDPQSGIVTEKASWPKDRVLSKSLAFFNKEYGHLKGVHRGNPSAAIRGFIDIVESRLTTKKETVERGNCSEEDVWYLYDTLKRLHEVLGNSVEPLDIGNPILVKQREQIKAFENMGHEIGDMNLPRESVKFLLSWVEELARAIKEVV